MAMSYLKIVVLIFNSNDKSEGDQHLNFVLDL